jgi:hypothetical protein
MAGEADEAKADLIMAIKVKLLIRLLRKVKNGTYSIDEWIGKLEENEREWATTERERGTENSLPHVYLFT